MPDLMTQLAEALRKVMRAIEDGEQCYEDCCDDEVYLGNAVRLEPEFENHVYNLLARYDAREGAGAREPDGWITARDAAMVRDYRRTLVPNVNVWAVPDDDDLPVYIGAAPKPVEREPDGVSLIAAEPEIARLRAENDELREAVGRMTLHAANEHERWVAERQKNERLRETVLRAAKWCEDPTWRKSRATARALDRLRAELLRSQEPTDGDD